MLEVDALVYKMAFVSVLIALVKRDMIAPALLLCASFLFNEMVFVLDPTWQQIEAYFFQLAIKDFLIAIGLFLMYRTSAFVLAITFVISCLFHKVAQIEVSNNILDLKHIRSDFMTYITAAQIATIYYSLLRHGGGNGGKRVRYSFSNDRNLGRSIFHSKTSKVVS